MFENDSNGVNNEGMQPFVESPPQEDLDNDISSDPGKDVNPPEVNWENKAKEYEHKLEAAVEKISFMEGFLSQQQNNVAQTTQPERTLPPAPNIPDTTIKEWEESGQPELILRATEIKAAKEEYGRIAQQRQQSTQIAKIKEEVKNEIRFEEFKNKALNDFPEIQNNLSPQYQAVNKELNTLMQGNYSAPDRVYKACMLAKANHPELFSKHSKIDNRDRLLGQSLSHNVTPNNRLNNPNQEYELNDADKFFANVFGVKDQKALKQTIQAMRRQVRR